MRWSQAIWSVRLDVDREPECRNHTFETVRWERYKLRPADLQQFGVSVYEVPARKEQLQLLFCFLRDDPLLTNVYTK